MKQTRAHNKAFQAAWHRQLATESMRLGQIELAQSRLDRAIAIENELIANRQCVCCGRALKGRPSVDGLGSTCRQKLRAAETLSV